MYSRESIVSLYGYASVLLCIEAETFDPVNSYHVVARCGIMNFGLIWLSGVSWIVIVIYGFCRPFPYQFYDAVFQTFTFIPQ